MCQSSQEIYSKSYLESPRHYKDMQYLGSAWGSPQATTDREDLFFDEGQRLCDSSLNVFIIQNYLHHSWQEPGVPKLSSALSAWHNSGFNNLFYRKIEGPP